MRRVVCRRCGTVKRERLDFLADNPHFTKRFAFYVGRRCRQASIRDVAQELKLDWDTVKTLEMQYMRAQIKRAGTPGPRAIGIDEISIRKGHSYRIVVSDLVRKRPIWFGGEDRSEASMGGRTIVGLAAAQEDGKKTAFSICDCVDFRVAPASRAANRLLPLPLFAPEAER